MDNGINVGLDVAVRGVRSWGGLLGLVETWRREWVVKNGDPRCNSLGGCILQGRPLVSVRLVLGRIEVA